MAVTTGDLQSIGTAGWWITQAAATPPATPVLGVVDAGTGTSVTATITGADAGATVTLYYRKTNDLAWPAGNTRVGNGAISQTGLTDGARYYFYASAASGGLTSAPSNIVTIQLTPSGTCIVERIAQDILSALGELIVPGDAAVVNRPLRMDTPDRPQDRLLTLFQGDPQEAEEQEHGFKFWLMPFAVECFRRPSDASTTPVDTFINDLRCKVEQKLLEDRQRSGWAVDTTIREPFAFDADEGYAGIGVNVEVLYYTLEDNPFALA